MHAGWAGSDSDKEWALDALASRVHAARGVYAPGMKTEVSIPDEVFERAERLARCHLRSRSEVYAAALDEYIARHAPDEVTDTMNRLCEEAGDEEDAFLAAAGRRALSRVEW